MPMTEGHVTITEDPDEGSGCCRGSHCCNRCKCKCCRCSKEKCIGSLQVILILIGAGAGAGVGVLLRYIPPFDKPRLHPREMMYLLFPAELLLRFLTFIVVPLIASSLISGIGALDSATSGKIGLRTLVYYLSTTFLAVCEGFGFIYAIQPANFVEKENLLDLAAEGKYNSSASVTSVDSFLDLLRNLVPDNFVTVAFQLTSTKSTLVPVAADKNHTVLLEEFLPQHMPSTNILGLTFMSICFGIAMAMVDRRHARPVLYFFDSLFEITLLLIRGIMWLYPILVFFMIAHTVVLLKNPLEYLTSMFVFLLSVLAGLFTHMFVILPLIYLIIARKNPYKLFCGCIRALITAFATSNSTATLPATMQCLEGVCVHQRIVRFMCPLGASVNMDGFALYESMAAIFIATLNGLTPSAVQFVTLGFTAVAISIGAPTAGGGIVLYVLLFNALNLPLEYIGLLVPFDWLLSRFRTMVNVWGDCVGAGIVHSLSHRELLGFVGGLASQDADPDLEISEGDLGDSTDFNGAILTRYQRHGPRDWTVRLVNEHGDKLVVSKV